jgi:Tfp pilus assembly protein PilO
MPTNRKLPDWSAAKWLLVVVLVVIAIALLAFAFELVRLLVDPSQRA